MVILSGTANPWSSISLMMVTTLLRATPSTMPPSSAMIFHPLRDPRALLMLKELSVCSTFPLVSGSGLTFLELTAELFLEVDNSRAFLKLRAFRNSLLKLRARLRAGLSALRCGLRRGESGGTGERPRGEGERRGEGGLGKSKGEGERGIGELAGVESGESSSISQNSNLISGVELFSRGFSMISFAWGSNFFWGRRMSDIFLNMEAGFGLSWMRGLGGTTSGTDCFLPGIIVAESRRFWFLRAVRKLSSRRTSVDILKTF